jgi:hypothetical protein
MKLLILFVVLLIACGKSKDEPLTPELRERFEEIQTRLMLMSSPPGWVISYYPDGREESHNDSLIWTGIHWATMPCDYESPLLTAFSGGILYRHPTRPGRVSMDGVLGFYLGMSSAINRCGVSEKLRQAFEPHYRYTVESGGIVNPYEPRFGELELEFDYIRDLIAYRLGIISTMPDNRLEFEAMLTTWTYGVMLNNLFREEKRGCFRIHLAYLGARSAELLGGLSSEGKSDFCTAQSGADLPLLDHWCGEKSIVQWLHSFKVNEWEYRHQRCPQWEFPDGDGNGLERPGLDYLIGYSEAKK